MARPPSTDRGAVADANLSVRLTATERARWDAFVARQAAAFRGTGARVTAASLARDVLVARLDVEGIPAELASPAAAPAVPVQAGFWPAPTAAGATAPAPAPAAEPLVEPAAEPPAPPAPPPSVPPAEPPAPPAAPPVKPPPVAKTAKKKTAKKK